MAGAKVGLPTEAGMTPSSAAFVHVTGAVAALAPLQDRLIDSFMMSPPAASFAESQGGSTVLATIEELPVPEGMAYDIVVVDTDYARSHPAVVRAVATAFAKADDLTRGDPVDTGELAG